jgi:hypothetical protein
LIEEGVFLSNQYVATKLAKLKKEIIQIPKPIHQRAKRSVELIDLHNTVVELRRHTEMRVGNCSA